jgi:hypothetical protein
VDQPEINLQFPSDFSLHSFPTSICIQSFNERNKTMTTYSRAAANFGNGYSMSFNAHVAQRQGRFPASYWPKILRGMNLFKGITTADIKSHVHTSEWHHASVRANRVNYYSLGDIFSARSALRAAITARLKKPAALATAFVAYVEFVKFEPRRGGCDRFTFSAENATIETVGDASVMISGEFQVRRNNNKRVTTQVLHQVLKRRVSNHLTIVRAA